VLTALQMNAAGLLGRKSGKGFFLYPPKGKKEKGPKQLNPDAVAIVNKHVKQKLKLSKVGGFSRRSRAWALF
jgi:enoyl-CoA hydratase / long-chain 3-hydroxyacyl-CoA dehydrogenase